MKDAEFRRKREKAYALMLEKGLHKNDRIPFLYRLLWRAGINVPPALFANFACNVCVLGTCYAVFWGCCMWFVTWKPRGYSPLASVIIALAAGLLFGLWMAVAFRSRRKAKGLPEWRQL